MSKEIDLLDLLQLLKKNWWKILICGITTALIALLLTLTMIKPKYQSTAKMVILNKSDEVKITYSDIQISNQLVKDSMEIIYSREIMEAVINELDLPLSPGGLKGMISISSPVNTRIVALTITDTDPERATKIAEVLYKYAKNTIMKSLDADAVNLFEAPVIQPSPVSPNIRNNGIIGAFLGMTLCVFILIAAFMLNTKITTPEDIEAKLKLPLLAVIPYNETKDKSKNKHIKREV